jgi:ComEC/Rec2-related protein
MRLFTRGINHLPIVSYFCAFVLGIIFSIEKSLCSILLLFLIVIYQVCRWGFVRGFGIVLCAICAFLWTYQRVPQPTVPLKENRTMHGQLLLERCAIRPHGDHRRIHGFARLLPGKIPIYFNLLLPLTVEIPHRGQVVDASFRLKSTHFSKNNFEKYLSGVGIAHRAHGGEISAVVGESTYNRCIIHLINRASRALEWGMDETSSLAHIYHGMLLGDRSTMTAYEKNTYSRTGIAHLFAISGLHIGIIGWLIHALTRGMTRRPFAIFLLRIFCLCIFVQMTGGSPSSWRAFSMVTIFWLAPLVYRKSDGLSSLFISAFLSLIINPLNVLNTSFQLSYGVVFSLLRYGVPLGHHLRRRLDIFRQPMLFEGRPRWIRQMRRLFMHSMDAVGLSIAATLPLIPISVYHFQTFSVGGILLNPIVMPLASIAIILGFTSLCLGLIGLWPLCFGMNKIAAIFLGIIHFCAGYVSHWKWIESWPVSVSSSFTLLWFSTICASMYLIPCPRLRFRLPLLLSLLPLPWLNSLP